MKNILSKVLSFVTMFTLVFSSFGLNTAKAVDIDPQVGTIEICKIIIDSEGEVVAGNEGTTFTIPFVNENYEGANAGTPAGVTFTTPFEDTETIFGDVEGECDTVEVTPGKYYYGEETISDEDNWETPRYHDQYTGAADSLDAFGEFNTDANEVNNNWDGVINVASGDTRTILVLNQMKPTPEVENTCPVPDALNDEDMEEVNSGAGEESDLQEILNDESYDLDVEDDQKQYQLWDVDTNSEVEIDATFIDKNAAKNSVFGYYTDSSMSNFEPIFTTSNAIPGYETVDLHTANGGQFTVNTGEADTIGFAIKTFNGSTGAGDFATENSLNTGSDDQVLVYNPEADTYVLAFEDVLDGDHDFNDLVVEVALSCSNVCEQVPVSEVYVSDTTTMQGENAVVAVGGTLNPGWTASIPGATWIWGEHPVTNPAVDSTETFTKTFTIDSTPTGATLDIATDNSYEVYVNNVLVHTDATEFNYTAEGQDNIVIPADKFITGSNTIKFVVKNWSLVDGTQDSNPAGLLYKLKVNSTECEDEEEEPTTATISVKKVVCDSETDLPNWGEGADSITSTTAQNYVTASEGKCELANWTFEWAPASATNPGDSVGDAVDWTNFTTTTNVPAGAKVWVREQADADYIPFTGDVTVPLDQNVSAEFYCSNDVLNYDNYEYIDPVVAGQTYHCVGFNVLKVPTVPVCDVNDAAINLLSNPSFELPEVVNEADWEIHPSGTPTLGWTVAWNDTVGAPLVANMEIQEAGLSGWTASEGDQWTELDSDFDGPDAVSGAEEASVAISQNIATDIGQDYTIGFSFSARPSLPEAQNKVEVLVNDVLVGTVGPTAGAGTTAWTNHTFDFTATTSTTKITFRDAGTPNDSEGSFLDNTSVNCELDVPEDDDNTEDDDTPDNTPETTSTRRGRSGSMTGGSPQGLVLGAQDVCNFSIDTYMRKGHKKNNAEQVKALQSAILNNLMGAGLTTDGVYGPKTEAAVRAFQIKYKADILDPWNITNPTGIFYKTTLVKAKNLICPVVVLPIPSDLINWSENPEVAS